MIPIVKSVVAVALTGGSLAHLVSPLTLHQTDRLTTGGYVAVDMIDVFVVGTGVDYVVIIVGDVLATVVGA